MSSFHQQELKSVLNPHVANLDNNNMYTFRHENELQQHIKGSIFEYNNEQQFSGTGEVMNLMSINNSLGGEVSSYPANYDQ